MLVNLSPALASASESLCSLRFAAQVAQVELGKAKKRVAEAPQIADAPSARASVAASGRMPIAAQVQYSAAAGSTQDSYMDASAALEDDGMGDAAYEDADLILDELEASTDMIALSSSRVEASSAAAAAHAGVKRAAAAMSAAVPAARTAPAPPPGMRPAPATLSQSKNGSTSSAAIRRGSAAVVAATSSSGAAAVKKARTLK